MTVSRDEVSAALGDIVARIIENTPDADLIVNGPNGQMTEDGVLYVIVQLLLDNDLKVSGFAVFEQLAPYLPEITQAFPGTNSPFDEGDIRDLFKDLFNDMSSEELEQALVLLVNSAVSRVSDLGPDIFDINAHPDQILGDLFDGILGPAKGAVEDIIGDRGDRDAFWAGVFNSVFGLGPDSRRQGRWARHQTGGRRDHRRGPRDRR